MFDKEKIARQALELADETEKNRRNTRRRTTAILSVCIACLGVFFLVFSPNILSNADEHAVLSIDDQQVPLASSPAQVQPGIRFGDSELTIIREGGTIQYGLVVVGEAAAYTFYMVDLSQEGDYTPEPIPDGLYRLMVGNIEIGTLTVTAGTPSITLW